MAEVDNRLDGRAFLQQDDPFVFVDGDDLRCPETGEVHPVFKAVLEHLGVTYTDVSTSGAGTHAVFHGEPPENSVKEPAWQIDDEPWGANDDLPSIEIYPGKHVCVMTGDHVPGTPTTVEEWNDDILELLLETNDQTTEDRSDVSTARDNYDLDNFEPTASETTDDIRDIFAALDRLDARRVAKRTIVVEWNDSASTSEGKRAFAPTWGRSSNGTANIVDDHIWQDTGDLGGYGGPVTMAAIDAGEIQPANAQPVNGEMCDGRGLPFLHIHRRLEDHNDQSTTLPCCAGSKTTYDEDEGDSDDGDPTECPAIRQWETYRSKRENNNLDAVFATHNLALVLEAADDEVRRQVAGQY